MTYRHTLVHLPSHVVYAAPAKPCHIRQDRNVLCWWWGKEQSVYSDQTTFGWNVWQIDARFPAGAKIYLISRVGSNRPIECVLGTPPGSKETRCGANHSPTSSVLVSAATPPLCHITSCHAEGHLHLYMLQAFQLSDLLSINLPQNPLMWHKVYIRQSPINKTTLQNAIITQTFWKGSKVYFRRQHK